MSYLVTALQTFFTDYVHTQRSLSANTIASYRDTWRIFIKYLTAARGVPADLVQLEHIDRDAVTGFLVYLRDERANSATTRNQRLTAIRSVMAYTLPDHPEHGDHIRQILALRPAKATRPQLHYLNAEETEALLAAPDTSTWTGRRDHALFTLAVTTGLRISEITSLTTAQIHLGGAPFVECDGKGRKHRSTPINMATCDVMRGYLQERSTHPGIALFPGPRGRHLSRDAVEHRLHTHLESAGRHCSTLPGKHLTFHVLRHTCAMNLLHAGVDITVISLWLGHEQTTTTDIYLHHDMQTKLEAMERTRPPGIEPGIYTPPADILAWLDTL